MELFRALLLLIAELHDTTEVSRDITTLLQRTSSKLMHYTNNKAEVAAVDQDTLSGYLSLLSSLSQFSFPQVVMSSEFGAILVPTLFNDFLFAFSRNQQDYSSLCQSPSARQAAYGVISIAINTSGSHFDQVISAISKLSVSAADILRSQWNCTVNADIRKNAVDYVGLKNQGGTCYMNSLLQQVHMILINIQYVHM
jgi:hypothetical protein